MILELAAALVAAMPATSVAAAGEAIPTRDCRSRIEIGRPLTFESRPLTVRVGPIIFTGLQRVATRRGLGRRAKDGRFSVKSAVVLRSRRPVILSVPKRFRNRLFLAYARGTDDASEVRLEPCPATTRAFSYRGRVGKVTGFNGGFSLTRRGCYPLVVRVVGGRSYRTRIAFGYPCR